MEGTNLIQTHTWYPLKRFGITHPFFALNAETIFNTWIALGILLLLIGVSLFFLRYKHGIVRYLVINFVKSFQDLTQQTIGRFVPAHFYFTTSLFLFLVICNCITLLPWTEEPTQDINTTLAMGILSFVYIQVYAIRAHGLLGYLKEYVSPIFVMLPLHVVGKLSSIISLSFRLFGNIFGGAVIARIWLTAIKGSLILETVGLLCGVNITIALFFTLFEGLLQAFVFSMLSLTYLALAIQGEPADQSQVHMGDLP